MVDPTGGVPGPPGGQVDPPDRAKWPFWAGIALVLTLLACPAVAVLAVTAVDRLADAPARGASAPATAGPVLSPQPGDPFAATQAWLRQRIGTMLDQQAGALLRGDEAGWVAMADPAAKPVVADLKRQFSALRAMRVAVWRPTVDGLPVRLDRDGRPEWRVPVTVDHCFVAPDCVPGPVTIATRWIDAPDRPLLVEIEPPSALSNGSRPWQVSDLVAQSGERTVVATTPALRARLPELLREAERAALVADRFAVAGSRPDRYRVYYAGKAEWESWYGGDRPEWTGAYAVPVGGGHYEVVLNSKDLHSSGLDDLLRHELTHAVSLPAEGYSDGSAWWLVEGLAEYAAAGGRPVSRYDSLADVRQLVSQGWTGGLTGVEPRYSAESWEVSARYGLGYLAVRHLVDRFGEQSVFRFYRAVVFDGQTFDEASAEVFRLPWRELDDACVAYIRSAAG